MLNTATLKQINEKKKKEKKNTINVDEKSTNVNINKIVKKRFSKKKENSRYTMFEDVVVRKSNARISMKHFINDTRSSSNVIENFSFKFENFLNEESNVEVK